MEAEVGAYEAKTHLTRLLDEVAATGKTIVITKHGVPVARLTLVRRDAAEPDEVIAAVRLARAGVRLGDSSLGELVEDGQR
jgi:prevent-host-death family protein